MSFTQEQKAEWKANRLLKTDQVIEKLSDDVKPYATKVGVWVWVTFKEKPDQAILDHIKGLGFRWNRTRKAWQHPCGVFRAKSPDDPRHKYGQTPVMVEEETAQVETASI